MNASGNQAKIKQQIIELFTAAGVEFAGDAETSVYPTPRMSGYWAAEVVGNDRQMRTVLEDAGIKDIRGLTEDVGGREVAIMRFVPILSVKVTEFTVKHLSSGLTETTVFPAGDTVPSTDSTPITSASDDKPVLQRVTDAANALTDGDDQAESDDAAKRFAQIAHDLIEGLPDDKAKQASLALHRIVDILNGKATMQYTSGEVTITTTKDMRNMTVELSNARQKIGRLDMDIERLKAELSDERTRVIAPGEVDDLRKQLAQARKDLQGLAQLQKDLQILKERPTHKELADVNMDLMHAKNQIVALTDERNQLAAKLSQLEADSSAVSAAERFIYSLNTPLVVDVELSVYDTAKSEQVRSANRQIADGLNSGKRIAYEQFDFVTGKHLVRWEFDHQESAQLPLNAAQPTAAVVPDEVIPVVSSRPAPFAVPPIIPQSPLNAITPVAPRPVKVPTHDQLLEKLRAGLITAEQYSRTANALAMYTVTNKG